MDIDPNVLNNLLNIVLSVAANGLTSLIDKSHHEIESLLVGKKNLEKQKLEKTALQPILQKAINEIADNAHWDADKGVEIVSLFLCTSEVEEIVRQIYSTQY